MFLALIGAAFAGDAPITAHLEEVLADLRAAPLDALDPARRAARDAALDVLEDYVAGGVYPHNLADADGRERPVPFDGAFDGGPTATPVFVDEHGTPCAVAAMLLGTGAGALVERVAEADNQVYVHELAGDVALEAWADAHGLTLGELARIQPRYAFQLGHFELITSVEEVRLRHGDLAAVQEALAPVAPAIRACLAEGEVVSVRLRVRKGSRVEAVTVDGRGDAVCFTEALEGARFSASVSGTVSVRWSLLPLSPAAPREPTAGPSVGSGS